MSILRIILIAIFLIAAIAMTVIVLMQEGKSAGLGTLGGTASSGDSYWDKNKKHSLEGKFERWTKMIAGIFVLVGFILMFIPSTNSSANVTTQPTTQPATSTDENGNGVVYNDGTAATSEATTGTDAAATSEATASTDTAAESTASASPEASAEASATPAQ